MKRCAALGVVVLTLLMGISAIARAQAQAPQSAPQSSPAAPQAAPPVPPQAQAKDVDSVEHILAAVYDVISGPAGPRDWERYAKGAAAYFTKEGFFEVSIANRVESWDHMAEVWSTYESRHAKGEQPFARGVNSFQLFFDGTRWWIVTIYWEDETPGHSLPEKYLTESK